jgi:hypothetical protein
VVFSAVWKYDQRIDEVEMCRWAVKGKWNGGIRHISGFLSFIYIYYIIRSE